MFFVLFFLRKRLPPRSTLTATLLSYTTLFRSTNHLRVWNSVQRFCAWEPYELPVFTRHGGRVFPMPISLATINQFYGGSLSPDAARGLRSEEHTSELQSLMRISYAVFCLKNKNTRATQT